MAALNKNIKTGNFIPGSETYTRPEEIAIMSKYLKSGIQDLRDKTNLGERDTVYVSPGQAEMKSIDSLPGSETLDSLQDTTHKVSLSKVSETLKVQKDIKLDNEREILENSNKDIIISSNSSNTFQISKKEGVDIYKSKPESIDSNEDGSKIEVTENVYDNLFWNDPKVDKRTLPDSENKDSKFKELDSLLGGVHFGKYSQEGLAQSLTPSQDAQRAYNEGTDVVFVHPEKIKISGISDLRKDSQLLSKNKELEDLRKYTEELSLENSLERLSNKREELGNETSFSLSNFSDSLEDSRKINLSESSENLYSTKDEISLSEIKDILDSKKKEIVLGDFIDEILEGRVKSLSDLKESMPGSLKKVVLIDYLKDKLKDDNEVKLYENYLEMDGTEKDTILNMFLDRLKGDLKKVVELNKNYITLGKNGSKNFLKDLYEELSDLTSSEFSPYIPGEIKNTALNSKKEKIQETSTTGSKELRDQLKKLYEISSVASDELGKSLNELENFNGNWGKKISAYLTSILGKYKRFKEYLPEEEVSNFRKLTLSTFNERDYEDFLKDPKAVKKDDIIREVFLLLRRMTEDRAERVKKVITTLNLQSAIRDNKLYSLTLGSLAPNDKQTYGESITLNNALRDIKTELVDETWESIKSWLKSVLNESMFGTTASLMLDKAKLPGQDYGHDVTVRNVPEVVGFGDKKTKTTDFTGTAASTALEIKSSKSSGISGWLTKTVGRKKYNFKENYLMAKGVKQTLKDLCDTDISQISSVEDLFDVLKNSEAMTAHARTEEGVMNGMTLSSNHVWEITIEPYIGDFNGNCTWLPFFQEINRHNYETHGVRTIYDKWLPVTSFELQDKRLVNKTLQLYSGEISYPISIEYTNELRLTFADDSFKSFKTYFDKVAEVSAYESQINTKTDYSIVKQDTIKIKQRTFSTSSKDLNTYSTVNKKKFAVGMYKNLCFSINIYILTPQYSTIKKYSLLCVMKDYAIEYTGEIDSGPADVTVTFSIVGETTEIDEFNKYKYNLFNLVEDISDKVKKDVDIAANLAVPSEKQVAPITVIDDTEIEDPWEKEEEEYNYSDPVYGNGKELKYFGSSTHEYYAQSEDGTETLFDKYGGRTKTQE